MSVAGAVGGVLLPSLADPPERGRERRYRRLAVHLRTPSHIHRSRMSAFAGKADIQRY